MFKVGDKVRTKIDLVGYTANNESMPVMGTEGIIETIELNALFPYAIRFWGISNPVGFKEAEIELVQMKQPRQTISPNTYQKAMFPSNVEIWGQTALNTIKAAEEMYKSEHTVSISPT